MTRRLEMIGLVILMLGMVWRTPVTPAHADVTGGQIADCTFATLQSDLQSGGTWTYGTNGCTSPVLFTGTITIPGGVTTRLAAMGSAVTLDGQGHQLFSVVQNGSLSLENLTLQDGSAPEGGAIASGGTLSVLRTTFTHNSASSQGGAIVSHSSSLTVTESTFSSNSVSATNGIGGAIVMDEGTVAASTFSGNTSVEEGGAIFDVGPATITSDTFVNNAATAYGADGGAIKSENETAVTNSTFTNNQVPNGDGGAIAAAGSGNQLLSDTIAGNAAGVYGAVDMPGPQSFLAGSILVNNTSSRENNACDLGPGTSDNVTDDGSCGSGAVASGTAVVGPLQDNGGPTQTMAPVSGSPAIDKVPVSDCFPYSQNCFCPTSSAVCVPLFDQRGYFRVPTPEWDVQQGGQIVERHPTAIDAGAYDSRGVAPFTTQAAMGPSGLSGTWWLSTNAPLQEPTPVWAEGSSSTFTLATSSVNGGCETCPTGQFMSLSSSTPLPAGLSFTDNQDGTATLSGTAAPGTAGSYTIAVTATVWEPAGSNPTKTVDPVPLVLPFKVVPAPTTATGGQVADCTTETLGSDLESGGNWYYAPGQCPEGVHTANGAYEDGGAVYIAPGQSASLTARGRDINLGFFGFYVDYGATLSLNGVTVKGFNGVSPGASDAIESYGTVTVLNSTFTDNAPIWDVYGLPANGGAISSAGTLIVRNSTFSGNVGQSTVNPGEPQGAGGAIYSTGSLTVSGSTFTGNRAGLGGAIYMTAGTVTNNTFTGNSATYGGAINAGKWQERGTGHGLLGNVFIANNTFSGNSAYPSGGAIQLGEPYAAVDENTFSGNKTDSGAIAGIGSNVIDGNVLLSSQGGNCSGSASPFTGVDLTDDGTCSNFPGWRQISTASAQLGSLANNGGPTQTMALGGGSSASGQIPAGDCQTQQVPQPGGGTISSGQQVCLSPFDQRGYVRTGQSYDAGAYDTNGVAPLSATSNTWTAGVAQSFTITSPLVNGNHPFTSLATTDALPDGLTFTDNHDGTATISGTPAAGVLGAYPIDIIASMGSTVDPVGQAFTIRVAAPVTVTADSKQVTYGAAAPSYSYSVSGLLPGDTAASLGPISCTSPYTPGSGVSTPLTITCSGGNNPDYDYTYVPGGLMVVPAHLTITPDNQTMTYGGTVPTFTYSVTGLQGSDTIAGVGTVSCDATASTYSAGSYPIYCSVMLNRSPSSLAHDYQLSVPRGTLTVSPATLTVAAPSPTITYGQQVPTLTPTYSGFAGGDTAASLTSTATCTTTAPSTTPPAGTYTVSCSGAADPNYAITSVTGVLTVNPAPLTVAANDASMTYGGSAPSFGATVTGWQNGDTFSGTGGSCSASVGGSAAGPTTPAGMYPGAITCSLSNGSNYTVTATPGTLTVNKASLAIAANAATMTYGDTAPAFTATVTGLQNADTFSGLGGVCSATANGQAPGSTTPAGSYPGAITCGITNTANYQVTATPGTLTVQPRHLTIAANNAQMSYGATTLPSFTATVSGLTNGDALTQAPTCTTTATPSTSTAGSGSHAGTYAITCSGGSAGSNYAIDSTSYVSGTLTVTPVPLTITANDASMTYGGTLPTFSQRFSGLVNGDTGSAAGLAESCVTAPASSHVGTYAITCSGATDPDYTITNAPGTLAITPAPLTISADDKTMIYGGALPGFTASYKGLVNGDGASAVTGLTLSSVATGSSHVGTYTITAANGSDPDYAITFVNGTLTINPAALTISADNKSMTYGGAFPGFTASYSGLVNGDGPDAIKNLSLTTSASTQVPTSHAGQYVITATGGSDPNYSITFVNGTLTITPASLTITAKPQTTTYGSIAWDTSPASMLFSGLVNGDTPAALGSGLTITSTATATSGAGSYSLTPAGVSDGDYAVTYTSGTLTVQKRTVTLQLGAMPALAQGAVATLSAAISGTGPLAGLSVRLALGSGSSAQSCSGVTTTTGQVSCTVAVNQALGPQPLAASFAGDSNNNPATAPAGQTIVYVAPTTTSAFVIGDASAQAAETSGSPVTFWGNHWSADNSLTGGAPSQPFRGYVQSVSSVSVGGSFTGKPADIAHAPSSVPSYLGVLVTSKITFAAGSFTGPITHLVVLHTLPGYGPKPEQTGTGTIVAQVP